MEGGLEGMVGRARKRGGEGRTDGWAEGRTRNRCDGGGWTDGRTEEMDIVCV